MMTRSHFAISTLLFFFSNITPVYSGSFEAGQWLPWKFFSDRYLGKVLSWSEDKSEYEFRVGEFTPKLLEVNFTAEGAITELIFSENGIESQLEGASSLNISGIKIDQIISRQLNGNIIQVHVKAECSAFAIEVKKLLSNVNFSYQLINQIWVPKINNLDLKLRSEDWNVSAIECTGIGGIGEELSKQISIALKNPEVFEPIIIEYLQNEINEIFTRIWIESVQSISNDFKLTKMLRPDEKGIVFLGEMKIGSRRQERLQSIDKSILSQATPQLIISSKGFEALLEDQYFNISSKRINLQNFEGFKKLMSSRVTQLFVWPDLRRYPSSNPFYLSMIPEESKVSIQRASNNVWNAQINSNGKILTSIGGSEIEYIYLGVTYATPFKVNLDQGNLSVSTANADLSLVWSYGLLYQLLYKPNTKISTKILKNAVRSSLSYQSVSRELPTLNLENKEWKLNNWKTQKDFITMDWL